MANLGVSIRIEGGKDAQGKVVRFSQQALSELRKAAKERAQKSVFRFKSEMAAEYTSKWATGALAAGVTYRTFISNNGIDVKFYIKDRRELRFVTSLLGGHFQQFPVGPFVIQASRAKALFIRFPHSGARRFIQGEGGRFAGSKTSGDPSGIRVKQVLWGKRSGGFPRDVIKDVAGAESVSFIQDMQEAIATAVAQVSS